MSEAAAITPAQTPVTIAKCRRCSAAASLHGMSQWWVSCDSRPTCGWTTSHYRGGQEAAAAAAICDWNGGSILWQRETPALPSYDIDFAGRVHRQARLHREGRFVDLENARDEWARVQRERTPEAMVLYLEARLKRVVNNGSAFRDAVHTISVQDDKADTIREALRSLVSAYDDELVS